MVQYYTGFFLTIFGNMAMGRELAFPSKLEIIREVFHFEIWLYLNDTIKWTSYSKALLLYFFYILNYI